MATGQIKAVITAVILANGFFNLPSILCHALNTSGRVTGYSVYNKNCIYYREDTIAINNNYINITKFMLQTFLQVAKKKTSRRMNSLNYHQPHKPALTLLDV